jgi:hypothetical protein
MMYYHHPNDIAHVNYIINCHINISQAERTIQYAPTMYYHHLNDITHVSYIINCHINIALAETTIENAFDDVLPSSK